ncbi:hypothetical protein L7F22_053041 [Adiantum nelumboides]|nr:hypothetical protein [Adiantum nelumboides]
MEDHLHGIKPALRNCKHEAQQTLRKETLQHDNNQLLLNSTSYPLFNRVIDSFARAAGVGAVRAISKQFLHCSFEGVHDAHGKNLHEKASSSTSKLHGIKLLNFNRIHVFMNDKRSGKMYRRMESSFPGAAERRRNQQTLLEELGTASLPDCPGFHKVENTARESLQWGLAAGMFTGMSVGLQEAQGQHKMGHTALAGALAGALTNIATEKKPHLERTLQSAITGGALAVAGEMIHRRF